MSIINESEQHFYMHIPRTKVNKNSHTTKGFMQKTEGHLELSYFLINFARREDNNPDIDDFWL